MEQLPLDFSQPTNRLTAIADVERKKNLVNRNTREGISQPAQINTLGHEQHPRGLAKKQ